MYITIPKSLILNPNITGNDLLTYAGMFFLEYKQVTYQTFYNIAGELYDNPLRKNRDIKESMQKLSSLFPEYVKTYNNKVYTSHFVRKHTEPFITITDADIKTILTSEYTYFIGMYWIYLFILVNANVNTMYKISDCPYKYYAEKLDISPQVISKYISALEELNIIYVYKPIYINHQPNFIGKYEDKEFINIWAKNHGYIPEKDDSNYKRSLMAKFNYLSKQVAAGNPSPYSRDEVAEIRKYVVEHNKYCKSESKVDSTYLAKIKDLSIIDNIKYT